jgi:large subunit ribosomal protein L33
MVTGLGFPGFPLGVAGRRRYRKDSPGFRHPERVIITFQLHMVEQEVPVSASPNQIMQEVVTLECTEARKEGKPVSRYLTKRNKKTVTERIEKKKYNPFLKRHTLHKEIK